MAKESNLEKLRKEYNILRKKYALPEFSELNKLFDIEEIEPDTEFLLRKIRRVISDRISGYLRFVEVLLNPSNSPFFFFKLIKKLDNSDREVLDSLTETLGALELEMIFLDLDYKEEKEAEFIKKARGLLNKEARDCLLSIAEKLKNKKEDLKKEKGSYFG